MCLIQELPQPYITHEQRIAYGILCAKAVYNNVVWNKWADNWLLNKDRTYADANAATAAAIADANSTTVTLSLVDTAKEAIKLKI